MIPERTSFLASFEQRFESGSSHINMLKDNKLWKTFIPNENSGPCYTYTPPMDSDPGDTNNMYITFNSSHWDPALEIFLHRKNTFSYSEKDIIGSTRITSDMLKQTKTKHPRAVGNNILK